MTRQQVIAAELRKAAEILSEARSKRFTGWMAYDAMREAQRLIADSLAAMKDEEMWAEARAFNAAEQRSA